MLAGIPALVVSCLITLLIRSSGIIGSPLTPDGIEYGNAMFDLILMGAVFIISFAVLDRLLNASSKATAGLESNLSWIQLLVTRKENSDKDN